MTRVIATSNFLHAFGIILVGNRPCRCARELGFHIPSSHAIGDLQVLGLLCSVAEYDEMPVRHNEDKLNLTLSGAVRYKTDPRSADDPHTKTNLLLQVWFCLFLYLFKMPSFSDVKPLKSSKLILPQGCRTTCWPL